MKTAIPTITQTYNTEYNNDNVYGDLPFCKEKFGDFTDYYNSKQQNFELW